MRIHPRRRRVVMLSGLAAAAVLAAVASVSIASARTSQPVSLAAQTNLRVNFSFATGFAATFAKPGTPPPGADNGCRPSAAHPDPVILVHGTAENQNDNWQAAAPLLANHGYCVYTFNYGGASAANPVQGTGEIAASAGQLASFVNRVTAATGAAKVDLVGHSQGGMMPRYYINFLGGAAKVGKLVGLAPSNFGTTLNGITTLGQHLGVLALANNLLGPACAACVEQEQGSPFLANLNAHPTVPGVTYTVIESTGDEVVTPFTNAFLPAAPNVTNITVNNQCAQDHTEHLEIAYDPVSLADMLNALDPAHPVQVPCVTVLPVTGPVGAVPAF
jgi:triacylglycerol esterase/lipase EstA (alpha/beta hydrolase family)